MNRKPFLSKIAALLLSVAAAIGAMTAAAAPASAWTYQPVSGSLGNVSLPTVNVGDLYSGGYTKFTFYSNTGPIAYRSPASPGTQVVKAKYSVEQWYNNRWVTVSWSSLLTGQIGSTQTGVQFQSLYLEPSNARGYFRVTWAFDWYTPQGTLLGSTYVLANQTTDHTCVTTARWCQVQPDYVRTGGYLTNSW